MDRKTLVEHQHR